MSITSCDPPRGTLSTLPAEDIVILASDTPWRVAWDLMTLGPFVSCGLLDDTYIRHLTVTSMVASACERRSSPDAAVQPCDHPRLPVFAAEMTLVDAAVRVIETGWELAVVLDREPRVVSARSVYRALADRDLMSVVATPTKPDLSLPTAADRILA